MTQEKPPVLDAVRAVGGDYIVKEEDFRKSFPNVEICVELGSRQTT